MPVFFLAAIAAVVVYTQTADNLPSIISEYTATAADCAQAASSGCMLDGCRSDPISAECLPCDLGEFGSAPGQCTSCSTLQLAKGTVATFNLGSKEPWMCIPVPPGQTVPFDAIREASCDAAGPSARVCAFSSSTPPFSGIVYCEGRYLDACHPLGCMVDQLNDGIPFCGSLFDYGDGGTLVRELPSSLSISDLRAHRNAASQAIFLHSLAISSAVATHDGLQQPGPPVLLVLIPMECTPRDALSLFDIFLLDAKLRGRLVQLSCKTPPIGAPFEPGIHCTVAAFTSELTTQSSTLAAQVTLQEAAQTEKPCLLGVVGYVAPSGDSLGFVDTFDVALTSPVNVVTKPLGSQTEGLGSYTAQVRIVVPPSANGGAPPATPPGPDLIQNDATVTGIAVATVVVIVGIAVAVAVVLLRNTSANRGRRGGTKRQRGGDNDAVAGATRLSRRPSRRRDGSTTTSGAGSSGTPEDLYDAPPVRRSTARSVISDHDDVSLSPYDDAPSRPSLSPSEGSSVYDNAPIGRRIARGNASDRRRGLVAKWATAVGDLQARCGGGGGGEDAVDDDVDAGSGDQPSPRSALLRRLVTQLPNDLAMSGPGELLLGPKLGSSRSLVGLIRGAEPVAVKRVNFAGPGHYEQDQAAGLLLVALAEQLRAVAPHPHLSRVTAVNLGPPLALLSALCARGPLSELLSLSPNVFSGEDLLRMAQQVASALDHVHTAGMTHRAVCAQSVLVTEDWDVRLLELPIVPGPSTVDALAKLMQSSGTSQAPTASRPSLGSSSSSSATAASASAYSQAYEQMSMMRHWAPEQLDDGLTEVPYTVETDQWMFGIFLHQLFTGQMKPWPKLTQRALTALLTGADRKGEQRVDHALPFDEQTPVTVVSLLRDCMRVEPTERPRELLLRLQLEYDDVDILPPVSATSDTKKNADYDDTAPLLVHRKSSRRRKKQ